MITVEELIIQSLYHKLVVVNVRRTPTETPTGGRVDGLGLLMTGAQRMAAAMAMRQQAHYQATRALPAGQAPGKVTRTPAMKRRSFATTSSSYTMSREEEVDDEPPGDVTPIMQDPRLDVNADVETVLDTGQFKLVKTTMSHEHCDSETQTDFTPMWYFGVDPSSSADGQGDMAAGGQGAAPADSHVMPAVDLSRYEEFSVVHFQDKRVPHKSVVMIQTPSQEGDAPNQMYTPEEFCEEQICLPLGHRKNGREKHDSERSSSPALSSPYHSPKHRIHPGRASAGAEASGEVSDPDVHMSSVLDHEIDSGVWDVTFGRDSQISTRESTPIQPNASRHNLVSNSPGSSDGASGSTGIHSPQEETPSVTYKMFRIQDSTEQSEERTEHAIEYSKTQFKRPAATSTPLVQGKGNAPKEQGPEEETNGDLVNGDSESITLEEVFHDGGLNIVSEWDSSINLAHEEMEEGFIHTQHHAQLGTTPPESIGDHTGARPKTRTKKRPQRSRSQPSHRRSTEIPETASFVEAAKKHSEKISSPERESIVSSVSSPTGDNVSLATSITTEPYEDAVSELTSPESPIAKRFGQTATSCFSAPGSSRVTPSASREVTPTRSGSPNMGSSLFSPTRKKSDSSRHQRLSGHMVGNTLLFVPKPQSPFSDSDASSEYESAEDMSRTPSTGNASLEEVLVCEPYNLPEEEKHADWMAELPKRLHGVPLTALSIPGSNVSLAIEGDMRTNMNFSKCNLEMAEFLRKLPHLAVFENFRTLMKSIWKSWMSKQMMPISQQLETGVRYLDVRISKHRGTFYGEHGLYTRQLKRYLREIQIFLDAHRKEVVILHFSTFANLDHKDKRSLLTMLFQYFGARMCRVGSLQNQTLEELWTHRKQILAVFPDQDLDPLRNHIFAGLVWSDKVIRRSQPKKQTARDLINYLNCIYDEERSEDKLHVTQAVVTADLSMVFGDYEYKSMRHLTMEETTVALQRWLRGKDDLNIISVDFVGSGNLTGTIIDLNHLKKAHTFV